jgi:hypothetical protein
MKMKQFFVVPEFCPTPSTRGMKIMFLKFFYKYGSKCRSIYLPLLPLLVEEGFNCIVKYLYRNEVVNKMLKGGRHFK